MPRRLLLGHLTLDETEGTAGSGLGTSPALPAGDVPLWASDSASVCQFHDAHHGEKGTVNLVGFTKGSTALGTILSPE